MYKSCVFLLSLLVDLVSNFLVLISLIAPISFSIADKLKCVITSISPTIHHVVVDCVVYHD